jgi:uracil-DNA glycosylase family 4
MTCGDVDLACRRCRLSKGRTKVVPGIGSCSSRIVFIGEGPGKDEDLKGEPFVGRAGKVLDDALRRARTSRSEVFITNLVKCRPPRNRRPRKDEIRSCRAYLDSELIAVKPRIICALGQTAANSLLDNRESLDSLMKKEWSMKLGGRNIRVVVVHHPAACLYQRKNLGRFQNRVKSSLEAAGIA